MDVMNEVNSTPKNTEPLVMIVRHGFRHKFRHAIIMFFIFFCYPVSNIKII